MRSRLAERLSGVALRWQIGALVLVGLVGIFAMFGILGSVIANDAKARAVDGWLSITTSTARYIDSEIEQRYAGLEHLAALVGASAQDQSRQRQTLDDAVSGPGGLADDVFLADPSGRLVWSRTTDASSLAAFVTSQGGALDHPRRYASGIGTYAGRAGAILAVPVFGPDGSRVATLGMVLRPDATAIADLVAGARGIAKSGHAELVDQFDRVIASTETADVLGSGEHPDMYDPLLASRKSSVGLTDPVTVDPADVGQRHDMAFVPLQTVPWGLALGGSDAELSAAANRWQQQLVLFGGITLAFALLLVWLTTRAVARPIQALTAASRQIAAGDLTTPIPLGGEGEVRALAQAFDQMRRELQQALSAVALEKSRYVGIVTSMADAVVTTDPALRITAMNPSAATLTGWRREDAEGRTCCDVICSVGGSPATCAHDCALLAPATDLGVTKETLHRPDGTEARVAISRSPIRDETGRLGGIVHVLRDISADERVDRLKDEFLSTVSHELRTPLGFITGYATTLLLPDGPSDAATTRRCVEVIADASKELGGLVDNLLDMTRIGANALSVELGPVRLRPLALAAVERIRVRAPGHRFVTAVPATLPPALADPHRVGQVLSNLLDNAIKYSPDGGRITVRAAAEDGRLRLTVQDEGLGIPADELPLLFERFRRGRLAHGRRIGGTGLGLAICKGIVEAHGGEIWAESPPPASNGAPRGTAITFTLPRATAETGPS